ncbi:MAG: hypothetical protein K2W96_12860, partial [Gemmataceae bacterium]|nr:hypothetical protein [Gemmataceae bacterium]
MKIPRRASLSRAALFLVALCPWPAFAAGPPMDAKAVIRLSIRARGGEAALKAFGKMSYYARMKKIKTGPDELTTIQSEKWGHCSKECGFRHVSAARRGEL